MLIDWINLKTPMIIDNLIGDYIHQQITITVDILQEAVLSQSNLERYEGYWFSLGFDIVT